MRSLILAFTLIFSLSGLVRSQETTEKINKSITEGNASSLSVHFNSSLDISLPDIDQTMSSAHATQVMKNFFKENPPKSYKVNHVGSSREATKYIIGTYKSDNKSFKVYALLKLNDDKYLIVQLQFEEE
jgi:hypothetical protein